MPYPNRPQPPANLRSVALVLAAGALAVSCAKKTDGGDSPALEDVCTLDSQTYCNARVRCWPLGVNDPRFQISWGNLQGCMDMRKATCMADLQRPSTGLSAARTESCAKALDAQSCPDFLAALALPTSQCPPAIGDLDDGTTCAVNAQCKSNYCDRADQQVCGACADKAGIGHTCDQTADCASGLTCLVANTDTGAQTCMTPPAAAPHSEVGQACGTNLPTCDTGLVCVGSGTMKTCLAHLTTIGATCDPDKKTAADCDSTTYLWCNRMTLKCEMESFVDAGQPCEDLPDGSLGVCRAGAHCVYSGTRPVAGTCVAEAGDGMPCFTKSAEGPACAPPLRCVLDVAGATSGHCRQQELSQCSIANPPPTTGPDGGSSD